MPMITEFQQSIELDSRQARLNCKATGSPKPLIQWQRNSQLILESNEKYSIIEKGTVLLIHVFESADQGNYECVASNQAGSASHSFDIVDYDYLDYEADADSGIKFKILPTDQTLVEGGQVKFECRSNSETHQISWLKVNLTKFHHCLLVEMV
jgi:hypothetical protein